jgi:hypothetical protein
MFFHGYWWICSSNVNNNSPSSRCKYIILCEWGQCQTTTLINNKIPSGRTRYWSRVLMKVLSIYVPEQQGVPMLTNARWGKNIVLIMDNGLSFVQLIDEIPWISLRLTTCANRCLGHYNFYICTFSFVLFLMNKFYCLDYFAS